MEVTPAADEHCSMQCCYTVDFLPISCNLCSERFCKTHATPDAHACPAQTSITDQTGSKDNSRITCSLSGCSSPTLFFKESNEGNELQGVSGTSSQVSCGGCEGIYCLKHRHQNDHNCSKLKETALAATKSQVLAQKAIANAKASSSSSRNSAQTTDPAKLAKIKAVELMKMRRKAEAANPRDQNADVPMDQRILVTVSYNGTEKVLWTRKDIVTGKALDLFAAKVGALTSPLSLLHGDLALRMDLPLSEQIESPASLKIERKT